MTITLDGQVALVTGAGTGLGRAHALALAERGARVVVNDIDAGPAAGSPGAGVVAEIEAAGGQAVLERCDVADADAVESMVARTVEAWGRVDILINNAGILRDKSFAKSDLADFRQVVDVHLMGSVHCSRAVWPHMVERGYGRILMTTSASGIYGNFGQANYGAAKAAVVGLMNVLAIEGRTRGIRVNALAPTAATRMTEDLLEPDELARLAPETVSPGAVFLVSPDAPTKTILAAGAGVFAVARMEESRGLHLPADRRTPEDIAAQWERISDMTESVVTGSAFEQTRRYLDLVQRDAEPTAARS
ncbi:3-oxoacyl-ACP reductase [Tersicoccus solisilvae]|uniref:3-oxoacyl-ACP reductase n=1 Tax=Tersicoccus solisilvae TaxID=1882339 RepID=A0ABQ1P301_9MICC|nr:SDR family NAD(P)-dependent oxidoreductase [Tersicoccus solisilvae]GGC89639.1 3-oxoacyl-ACP reductase [Tersicoccus solisilvae]